MRIPSSKCINRKKITNNREKTGRKPGAQPGHPHHPRKPMKPDKVAEVNKKKGRNVHSVQKRFYLMAQKHEGLTRAPGCHALEMVTIQTGLEAAPSGQLLTETWSYKLAGKRYPCLSGCLLYRSGIGYRFFQKTCSEMHPGRHGSCSRMI